MGNENFCFDVIKALEEIVKNSAPQIGFMSAYSVFSGFLYQVAEERAIFLIFKTGADIEGLKPHITEEAYSKIKQNGRPVFSIDFDEKNNMITVGTDLSPFYVNGNCFKAFQFHLDILDNPQDHMFVDKPYEKFREDKLESFWLFLCGYVAGAFGMDLNVLCPSDAVWFTDEDCCIDGVHDTDFYSTIVCDFDYEEEGR